MTEQTQQNNQETENKKAENKEQKNQGMFRLSGVAALLATLGVVGGGTYLFADSAAKFAIKQGMELSFRAQTDIESVDISWSPFGVTINNLAQTDASQPSHNLFEVESLSAQVDLWQLLLGKYVMEKVEVKRLTASTERAQEGEVFQSLAKQIESKASSAKESSEKLGMSVPSVDELLAQLDLQTPKKGKALEQVWKQEKVKLDKAFKELPNEQTLEELKADWKKLTSNELKSLDDIAKLEKQLKQLKAKIDEEKASLKQAKTQYKESKGKLDVAYDELQQAAKDDWQRVESQVPFDNPNAVAVAKMLFGEEVAAYLEQAQALWQKAQPYIEQQQQQKAAQQEQEEQRWNASKNFEFALYKPLPDWIVNELIVSAVIAGNEYQITGSEITSQSYVIEKPSLYQVSLADEFKLNGQYYVEQSMQVETSGDWQVTQLKLADKSLSNTDDLALTLSSASLNGQGNYSYKEQLESSSQFGFNQTRFTGSATTKLAQLTLDTLENVDSFKLSLGVSGQVQEPDIAISSDLDTQLGNAFKSAFSNEWTKVKASAKTKLEQQLKEQFDLDDTELGVLQSQLSGLDKDFTAFGKGTVEDILKQQEKKFKDKLKDKAKDKLKDKLKDLFGE